MRLYIRNKESKFHSKIASNNVSLQNKNKTKTCCIVVVQYLALTLTIINIHETATLQPLRMVKLIMLTGSFNCLIQSKQFSCNKWHNNYAHNLTRWQWQVEEWHTHLHKVQRTHLHTRTHIHNKQKVKSIQARWKNNNNEKKKKKTANGFTSTAAFHSPRVVNMIYYHMLLFSVIHLLCQCTQRGNRNASKVADLLSKIFISRLARHDWSL